jgi:hypothetical protein
MPILAHNQLRHDDRVRSRKPQPSRPELGGRDGGRVDNNLISSRIEGRCSFEAAHKRSVAKFRLTVGTEDGARSRERQPLGLLLFGAVVLDSRLEED